MYWAFAIHLGTASICVIEITARIICYEVLAYPYLRGATICMTGRPGCPMGPSQRFVPIYCFTAFNAVVHSVKNTIPGKPIIRSQNAGFPARPGFLGFANFQGPAAPLLHSVFRAMTAQRKPTDAQVFSKILKPFLKYLDKPWIKSIFSPQFL